MPFSFFLSFFVFLILFFIVQLIFCYFLCVGEIHVRQKTIVVFFTCSLWFPGWQINTCANCSSFNNLSSTHLECYYWYSVPTSMYHNNKYCAPQMFWHDIHHNIFVICVCYQVQTNSYPQLRICVVLFNWTFWKVCNMSQFLFICFFFIIIDKCFLRLTFKRK
jgi:hypothetical protein